MLSAQELRKIEDTLKALIKEKNSLEKVKEMAHQIYMDKNLNQPHVDPISLAWITAVVTVLEKK